MREEGHKRMKKNFESGFINCITATLPRVYDLKTISGGLRTKCIYKLVMQKLEETKFQKTKVRNKLYFRAQNKSETEGILYIRNRR